MVVNAGDRVEVESERVGHLPRTGVVTGVRGALVTVRWDDGHDSTFAPLAGSMRVTRRADSSAQRKTG